MPHLEEHSVKFKAFCITVRPKRGLHGVYAEAVEKYIRKQAYYVYNYEKEDEARHIHAQIFFEEAVRKSNIQTALKRIAEKHDIDWSPAARKVLVSGVKIAYNDNFIDNYITKDNEVSMENYNPPSNTDEYYPTEEEQKKAIAQASVADKYFNAILNMWNVEHDDEYKVSPQTLQDVGHFIYKLMFVDKVIPVISDTKRRKDIVKAATHYLFPYYQSWRYFMFTEAEIANFDIINNN